MRQAAFITLAIMGCGGQTPAPKTPEASKPQKQTEPQDAGFPKAPPRGLAYAVQGNPPREGLSYKDGSPLATCYVAGAGAAVSARVAGNGTLSIVVHLDAVGDHRVPISILRDGQMFSYMTHITDGDLEILDLKVRKPCEVVVTFLETGGCVGFETADPSDK